MDFCTTPSVKIYTDLSPTAKLWGFFPVALMRTLVCESDAAGVLELDERLAQEDLHAAVALAIKCPDVEWVRVHLPKLLADGAVEVRRERYLVLPRYLEGQYSSTHPSLSQAMSRRKYRDVRRAVSLGLVERPCWIEEEEEVKKKKA